METRPILTHDQIEKQVFERVPVMPGEKKCRFERDKCAQLREHIRKTLRQQNINNAEFNRKLQERSMQGSGRES